MKKANNLQKVLANAVAAELSKIFGGATTTDGGGSWIDASGALVTEAVKLVRSNTTYKVLSAKIDRVLGLAARLRDEMRQEVVSVEISGKLIFV